MVGEQIYGQAFQYCSTEKQSYEQQVHKDLLYNPIY